MRDLQKEYIDLTNQLADITRRRNEVGEMLAAALRQDKRAAVNFDNANVLKALIAIGDHGDWEKARELVGTNDARLVTLFHNMLRHVRRANPDHLEKIPTRFGPRTLEAWPAWAPYVKRYLKTLRAAR